MYEETERFSIKGVLVQIILTVLFVFLLLWLFPTKSYVDSKLGSIDSALQPLYNQIFAQNVANMKDAAISYYTTERLPKNIGDKDKLTLGEMLDKKLLISFLDSNNKQCSLTDSYVEITKMDNEYILKVNLSCSDNSDYILVHLGCYSYCSTGLCEKQETPVVTATKATTKTTPTVKPVVNKKYEYEYEKVTNGKWGDWSDWSDWSTAKATNTDYRSVRTKDETVVVDTETIKVGTTTKVTDAKATTTYSCPNGYEKNGTTCTRNVTTTDTKDVTTSCPSGYTQNGNKCTRNITNTTTDTKNATLVCPSGYTLSGTKCNKNNSVVSYYKKGAYVKTVYNAASVPQDTNSYFYDMTGSDYVYDCTKSCAFKWVYTYKVYKAEPVYTTKTDIKDATLVCPSGYSLNGSTCTKNITNTSVKTIDVTTSCPSGYTQNGNKCTKQTTTKQTINASSKTTYSCTSGDLVGKSCVTYEDKYETFNKYATVTYYSYRQREYISGDRKTVWSNSQTDKTLLDQGYILTGKSREI